MQIKIIEGFERSGFTREKIALITESDVIRINKQLKLDFKMSSDQNLDTLSKMMDILKDDLSLLKSIFKEDLIYYTLKADFKKAANADFFYFSNQQEIELKSFFQKYFLDEMIYEFKTLISNDDFKNINAYLRIRNIYPLQLIEGIEEALSQKLDFFTDFLSDPSRLKWNPRELIVLKNKDYLDLLSYYDSTNVSYKLEVIVNLLYKCLKAKRVDEKFLLEIFRNIRTYPHLTKQTKLEIDNLLRSDFIRTQQSNSTGSNIKLFFIILFFLLMILVKLASLIGSRNRDSEDDYISELNKRAEQFAIERKRTDFSAKFVDELGVVTNGSCESAYNFCHFVNKPYTKTLRFGYKVLEHGLSNGESAKMGFNCELQNVKSGRDICFINKTGSPALLLIVRYPNSLKIATKKFHEKEANYEENTGCGRYYVGPGKSLKFDSRVYYFKIQTGKKLNKVRISSLRRSEDIYGYAFCPFTKKDSELYDLKFLVTDQSAAIGGVLELSRSHSDYRLFWKGQDMAIKCSQGGYLKDRSILKVGK